ncbi:hypothetical protein ACHAP8_009250 [Fusarium lateritium]
MSLPTYLRRALLYVPGSSRKMLSKSSTFAVDSVIYDLEDSVTPELKELARSLVAEYIATNTAQRSGQGPEEVAVRINAVDTGLALQDVTRMMVEGGDNLDTIVVPKVQSAADLRFVTDIIRHVAPQRSLFRPAMLESSQQPEDAPPSRPIHVIGLIESAMGLANVLDICRAGRTLGLVGLGFAAEDYMASVGLSKLPDRREVLLARSTIVNACRAYGIPSIIDMVSANVSQTTDARALEEECREGRSLGFTGKQAIHPSQAETIQRAFAPSSEEVQWAAKVYLGDIDSQKRGKGAWKLDGQMIDAPVVKKALSLLGRARACGVDVDNHISKVKLDAWEGRLKSLL